MKEYKINVDPLTLELRGPNLYTKIFNVRPLRPEHPINDEMQWQSTNREQSTKGELWMIPLNADVFCQKIKAVCDALGYKKNTRPDSKAYLGTLVPIRNV